MSEQDIFENWYAKEISGCAKVFKNLRVGNGYPQDSMVSVDTAWRAWQSSIGRVINDVALNPAAWLMISEKYCQVRYYGLKTDAEAEAIGFKGEIKPLYCLKLGHQKALDEITHLSQEMGDYQFDDQDIASYAAETMK